VVGRDSTLDPARALAAGVARQHRVDLPRDWRRRAIPARSARPADVRMAACPGGVWLDVTGRAGVLFSVEQWAQLALEAVAVLVEVAGPDENTGAGR
jgi:hypothetical protein